MAFYRTYRPQVIDEIDNIHVREQITSLLRKETKELPHAYLLTGPKGAGKTTTARIIAKLYNCKKFSKKTGPCGVCEDCTSIALGTNMDVLEIDAASNRGIDEIRELRDRIALAPVGGKYKIYIIDEVHMLTTEAFNALLKTLEEPPRHAVFILATTDPQKVPATIKSRCISILFRKATKEELISALKKIVKKEDIDIDTDALSFIAMESDGAFRDAVKFLEQVSFLKKKITIDAITDILSTSVAGQRDLFLEALAKNDEQAAFTIIETLISETKDIRGFIVDVLRTFQKYLERIGKGESVPLWNKGTIVKAMNILIDAYSRMKVSPIAEVPIELAIMDFCHKEQDIEMSPARVSTPTVFQEKKEAVTPTHVVSTSGQSAHPVDESFTIEKLNDCWKEVIEAMKPYNNSAAGVLRSTHPKTIHGDVVTIETQYKFHQERLSEPKVRDILATVFKKLFGVHISVEVVLENK